MNKKNQKIRSMIEWYRRIMPDYAHIPLSLCLVTNMIAYLLPRILNVAATNDFSIALDQKIPFMPFTAYIYVAAFAYWAINYTIVAHQGRRMVYRLFWADAIGKAVCLVCFLAIPSYIVQPLKEEITGPGAWLLKLVYMFDEPNNLLPSIHCFVSWLCFRPLVDKSVTGISNPYKVFSFVFTMLICISTLTTKQHVFVDTFTGIFLAEAGWILSKPIANRIRES